MEDEIEYIPPDTAKFIFKLERGTLKFLLDLFRERQELEIEYSKKLQAWAKKNNAYLDKTEYLTMSSGKANLAGHGELSDVVRHLLEEAYMNSKCHEDVSERVIDGPMSVIKQHLGSEQDDNIGEQFTNYQNCLDSHSKRVQEADKAHKKYIQAVEKLVKLKNKSPMRKPSRDLTNPALVSAETQVDVAKDKYESFLRKESLEREKLLEQYSHFEHSLLKHQTTNLQLCLDQLREFINCLHHMHTNREDTEVLETCLSGTMSHLDECDVKLLVQQWRCGVHSSLRLPTVDSDSSFAIARKPQTTIRKLPWDNEYESTKDSLEDRSTVNVENTINRDLSEQISSLTGSMQQSPKVTLKRPPKSKSAVEKNEPPKRPPPPQKILYGRFLRSGGDEDHSTTVQMIGSAEAMEDALRPKPPSTRVTSGHRYSKVKEPRENTEDCEKPPPARRISNAFMRSPDRMDGDNDEDFIDRPVSRSSSSHSISMGSIDSVEDKCIKVTRPSVNNLLKEKIVDDNEKISNEPDIELKEPKRTVDQKREPSEEPEMWAQHPFMAYEVRGSMNPDLESSSDEELKACAQEESEDSLFERPSAPLATDEKIDVTEGGITPLPFKEMKRDVLPFMKKPKFLSKITK